MQTGEYIVDRWMVGIIRDICASRGIGFTSLSDGWLLELADNQKIRRVLGYKFSLNDAVSSGIAGDKVAAHLLLERAGVPSVKHVLLRPKVTMEQRKPIDNWDKIVIKPLDGSGGHGVRLFSDADEAIGWIESTGFPAWAAAPFIDIKREIRLVLLDQKPLIVYEKQPVEIDGLKMFNLGMGATPQDLHPDDELLSVAILAQKALGLRLSAVDIVESMSGDRQVLEVNSGFMMEHYMRFSEENRARTAEAYAHIVDAVMSSE